MWGDLERPPLSGPALARALAADGYDLRVVDRTASTNADLLRAAAEGAAEGRVLVAEHQHGGRGRLGRGWTSPPRAGLTYSVLLRPPVVSGWLPLLTGLSLVLALREQAEVEAAVKWPNDVVLVSDGVERKVAGILVEVAPPTEPGSPVGVVLGIGLNVTTRADEFAGGDLAGRAPDAPPPVSLAAAGARTTDRETLLKAHLRALAFAYTGWRADAGSVAPLYRSVCRTLGREVRLDLPDGRSHGGVAVDVDADGRLLVEDDRGRRSAFAAGDVVHLRPRLPGNGAGG